MDDLLALSARYIDEDIFEGPGSVNRINMSLSEVADGVGFIESFSNVVALDSGDGLVLFDTSLEMFGPSIVSSLRGWSTERVGTICYTHGHVDHVGGAQSFLNDAKELGHEAPAIVAHTGVAARFDRYELTNGYNGVINRRQFAAFGSAMLGDGEGKWGPKSWVRPQRMFDKRLSLSVGDLTLDLRHAKGETDDHMWGWIPEKRAVCAGDFVAWVFPNCGNPQKVQRYPAEWAAALREMIALEPELLLPAHGLPVGGKERVRRVLDDLATVLESLVAQTLERMNAGQTLDDCLHGVKAPAALMTRPYLRPVYDEPEFVVRNIWRLYGGWYDGNPSRLKPAPDAAVAREVAMLAGGAAELAERASALCDSDLRLACQLVEFAAQAAPSDAEVHAVRHAIYSKRRDSELSLMARGIYATAANESATRE